jgi:TRAP-type mannitol/chloroaromatic compound transport system permease small subunit
VCNTYCKNSSKKDSYRIYQRLYRVKLRFPSLSGIARLKITGGKVNSLLGLSRLIDGFSERVGKSVYWLILAAVLISALNAVVRKIFNMSSNAFLEIQWYLFSAVFLLNAGYTLLHKEHVRIDVISGRLSKTKQIWIDIIGLVFFLIPFCLLVIALSWPLFVKVLVTSEMSSNAGGLIRWPVYVLMPLGFRASGCARYF